MKRMALISLFLVFGCRDDPKETGVGDSGDTQGTVGDADGDGFPAGQDCNDSDAAVNPDARETCDGIDNDCDGLFDDEDTDVFGTATYYADSDGDGYGGQQFEVETCEASAGYVENSSDCNDNDAAVNPDAQEACDGVDNDCDGTVDGDDASGSLTWYEDNDGDGYGTSASLETACDPPAGYALHDGDCDDADPAYHPGALEADCTDANDYNCDGSTGYDDADSDGFAACEDCDDSNAGANDDATEVCDGVDNDCDGDIDSDDGSVEGTATFYGDADGDGYGGTQFQAEACEAPAGFVTNSDDCNDVDATSHPGASEVCDDSDNDCDGDIDEGVGSTWYADTDSDGYGNGSVSAVSCTAPSGYVGNALDCDDFSAATNPGSYEICDGADNDCDGTADEDAINALTWFVDSDGDGFGSPGSSVAGCDVPTGYAADDTDCDDTSALVSPAADEYCDSIDNDCDGNIDESSALDATTWYTDDDSDGYGSSVVLAVACSQPSGSVANADDCDDSSAANNPLATEVCDGFDNDCDGATDNDASDATAWYADLDSDGYGSATSMSASCSQPGGHVADATDCDDTNQQVNSGVAEVCDSIDNNCDGVVDESTATDASTWYLDSDSDGFGLDNSTVSACEQPGGYAGVGGDCNDDLSNGGGSVSPGVAETCDGVDNDCSGTPDDGEAVGAAATCSRTSCLAILNEVSTAADGTYYIDPDSGGAFEAYCDMTTNGGGWTLVMNVAPNDGNSVGYNNQDFWTTNSEYGSFGGRFANDYKSQAAYRLSGDFLLIESADTGSAGSVLGWRRWPMTSTRTLDSFFTTGIVGVHATDSCETDGSDASDVGTTSSWDDIIRQGSCLYADVNPSTSGEGDTIRLTTISGNSTDNNMSGFASCIDCGTHWQGGNTYMGVDRAPCNSSLCHYNVICEMPSGDCLGNYCSSHYWNSTGACTESPTAWNSRFYVR